MSKPSQPMLDKFLLNGSFQCNKKKLEKKGRNIVRHRKRRDRLIKTIRKIQDRVASAKLLRIK